MEHAARQEGVTLGPYRLMEQVGMGGMATVYKAFQPSMDRYVALKILPQHYAQDRKFVQRFIREAKTIAKLEHKNILPVHDFGEENGTTYLAMRYLEGGTLKDILGLGRLTLTDAAEVLAQVSSALDYAHRQGVVHRDVKPANIMIDDEGWAYLTDFGIAKLLKGTSDLTTGTLGTPTYMAPEQTLGEEIDGRTDIYALGVILYEIVTGRVPFQADTPIAVALKHVHEPLPLPREVAPEVPEPIERVILTALAKKSDHRYQSAGEFAEAFAFALEDAQVGTQEARIQVLAEEAKHSRSLRIASFAPVTMDTLSGSAIPAVSPGGLHRYWPLLVGGLLVLIAVAFGGLVLTGNLNVMDVSLPFVVETPTPEIVAELELSATVIPEEPTATRTPRRTITPRPSPTVTLTPVPLTPDEYLELAIIAAQTDAAAAFAAEALVLAASREPTYSDDFSDPASGHVQVTGGNVVARYEDGMYVMGNGGGGININRNFTDVVVQMDASLDRFGIYRPSWGQIFVHEGSTNARYGFEINGYDDTTRFQLGGNKDNDYAMFAGGLKPSGVSLDLGTWHNVIGITVGNQIAYFADGQLLVTVMDDASGSGGISISTGDKSLFQIDNLRIWDVSQSG